MSKNSEIQSHGRSPKSRKEESGEYGPGSAGVVMCEECGAAYYKKSWKHGLDDHKNISEEESVRFTLCPACKMEKEGLFEGEVIIENMPSKIRDEVVGLIENVGDRARKRDPMDRIITTRTQGEGGLLVLTTENQLAVSIGKQIVRSHKSASVNIKWSDSESVARVHVSF